MKNNKQKLESAPMGMYAVVDVQNESLRENIKPGIIFTLKQINTEAKTEENNALYPYYMVYVYDNGEVKYNFLRTKSILDFYKKLCSGRNEVLVDLVNTFNDETNDGKKMNQYSDLLENAIDNIIGKKEEKGMASLFKKGGTTVQKSLFKGIEDFELVSFLIVK